MKHLLIFIFCIAGLLPSIAQDNTKNDPSSQRDPNAFTVIDMKINSSNYLIVSCRDDFGRTIQFLTGASQIAKIKNREHDALALGVTVATDFSTGTVSIPNNPDFKYTILKPFFLNQCCSISKIEYRVNNEPVDFVIAKEDTANGLTYFNKSSSPDIILRTRQPIYQKVFNNKRYAVLKPADQKDINKNIFYSYEFKYMSRELYNSHRKNVTGNNIIANKKDPVKVEIPEKKILEYKDTSQGQTQKVNTDTTIVNNNNPGPALSVTEQKTDIIIPVVNEDPGFSLPLPDSARYEITSIPGGDMAAAVIQIDVPVNAEYTINIYNRFNNRIYSSNLQRKFVLFPEMYNSQSEIYNIDISGMLLKNVPVQKGMNTRIKTGTLSITADLPWSLYNENQDKIYRSAAPRQVEFPVGYYELEINGASQKIMIKDRQALEFNTIDRPTQTQKLTTDTGSVGIKQPVQDVIVRKENTDTSFVPVNKDPIVASRKIEPGIAAPNKDSVFSPSSINSGETEISEIQFGKNMATGILHIDVPADAECTINIYSAADHTLLFNSSQQRSFSLLPGTYDIEISGMTVKNITVNKAMDTRIKAGVLSITADKPWRLYDNNNKTIHNSAEPKKLGLPTGIYQLEINGSLNPVEIKDRQFLDYDISGKAAVPIQKAGIDSTKNTIVKTGETNPLPVEKKWDIKQNSTLKGNSGRIFLTIPKEVESIISITQAGTEKELYYSGILTKERSFSLSPGNYDVKVSGNTVKNVPVQKGMDTRIRSGVLEVAAPGIWILYDEKKDKQVYFSTTAKRIGLPAGIYQLEMNGNVNQVTIKDGETVKF